MVHSPFLYTDVTYSFFQSKGSSPWCSEAWYMSVREGTMLTEVSLKNLDGIPSGPDALCGTNFCSSWSTPSVVIFIGGIWGNTFSSRVTVGVELASVKTDWNWLFKIVALQKLSVIVWFAFTLVYTHAQPNHYICVLHHFELIGMILAWHISLHKYSSNRISYTAKTVML